jgi:hypothetical protein
MTVQTLICGLLLGVIGAVGYLNGEPNPDTGKVSPTALIPLFFGVALVLCAVIVMFKESLRKHVMHLAAMIGLVGVIGGLMPAYRQVFVKNLNFDPSARGVMYGLLMSAICLLFVGLCVTSFIAARKARKAEQ